MTRSDAVVTGIGGLLGALSAVAVLVWGYLRRCEAYSERGFGEKW